MTDIPIQALVKCPMLSESEPCDLSPVKYCWDCSYYHLTKDGIVIDCRYEP